MAKVIERRWRNGQCIEEKIVDMDIKLNEADLDTVEIACECGNRFDMPKDCLMFGLSGMFCGQCGQSGKMRMIPRIEFKSCF